MVHLPQSSALDIGILARLFRNTTNSYKYFFFLALLSRARQVDMPIKLHDLAVDMVLSAWYPARFCRLSLGIRDQLAMEVEKVNWGSIRGTWITTRGSEWDRLRKACKSQLDSQSLMSYVPFRLLRPFFDHETQHLKDFEVNRAIASLSRSHLEEKKPLYWFTEDGEAIVLQHDWAEYLDRNSPILDGWLRFKLAEYLQARNPTVPGILEKLIPPQERVSLSRQGLYWKTVLETSDEGLLSLYTGLRLQVQDFSLDHFIPWSFLIHDRLWNLIPVEKGVNSQKGDKLPDRDYLPPFAQLHHKGILQARSVFGEGRWLGFVEPYLSDLHMNRDSIMELPKLRLALTEHMEPLLQLAGQQGFAPGWRYGT